MREGTGPQERELERWEGMGVLREDHKVGVTVLRGRLQERVRDSWKGTL